MHRSLIIRDHFRIRDADSRTLVIWKKSRLAVPSSVDLSCRQIRSSIIERLHRAGVAHLQRFASPQTQAQERRYSVAPGGDCWEFGGVHPFQCDSATSLGSLAK